MNDNIDLDVDLPVSMELKEIWDKLQELTEILNSQDTDIETISKETSFTKQLTTVLEKLSDAFQKINTTPPPQPVVKTYPEIKVTSPEVKIPEIKMPSPVVQVESYDYTSLLIELKRSVDKLTKAIENRPKEWKPVRGPQGFMTRLVAVE